MVDVTTIALGAGKVKEKLAHARGSAVGKGIAVGGATPHHTTLEATPHYTTLQHTTRH